jgi:predicted transcriptional regulator
MALTKSRALELLGGTPTAVAEALGITPSAVSQWPDDLPGRIEDRVLAALARRHLPPELIGAPAADQVGAAHAG